MSPDADHPGVDVHPARHYVKIWALLCALLAFSFFAWLVSPLFGSARAAVVVVTAFGVATAKAYLVGAYFMHLKIEKRLASIIIVTALVLMGVLYTAAAPDIEKHEGLFWVNVGAKAETARRIEREGAGGEKLEEQLEDQKNLRAQRSLD